jgi:uncharacterized phage-like protein YoqJ
MKVLITGHRLFKLSSYDLDWIKEAVELAIVSFPGIAVGLSGMASGVDLWFCQSCHKHNIPYIACPPFEEQVETIPFSEKELREWCLTQASDVWKIRNSQMVARSDAGIVVFDGNKGGTHNVMQQLVENNKPFIWINPVGQKVWECF